MKKYYNTLAACILLLIATSAQASLLYFNDFEGAVGQEWSTTQKSYDNDTSNFLGRFGNNTASLRLENIAPHTTISVSFDLILWDSWDGDNTHWGKDYQGLTADGTKVYEYTFASPGFGVTSTNPDNTPQLTGNFGFSHWQDALYKDFNDGFTFNHVADTLNLTFYGRHLQGINDESWGIDNVRVYTDGNPNNPVPEPATMLLFGTGLAGLGFTIRRKKRK